MQSPFVSRTQYEDVVYKLECLLCYVTGGRLSKASYELRTMETAATVYMNEQIDEERAEAARMAAEEIFEEITRSVSLEIPIDIVLINKERDFSDGVIIGKREAFFDMVNTIAELKKKYTEEQHHES